MSSTIDERAVVGTLRDAHWFVGFTTVAAFLGTGIFMKLGFPDLYAASETIRFTFRANHIYLLCAGLVNLAFGGWPRTGTSGWRAAAATFGSVLVLLAPIVLLGAFFVEAPSGTAERPLTFIGIVFVAFGVGARLLDRPR